jgi:hypothetical protein
VQELVTASGKQHFQDYSLDRYRDDEEAYLSAGYSAAEAKVRASFQLPLPQFTELKQLGQDWINYSDRYKSFAEAAADRWLIGKYGQK